MPPLSLIDLCESIDVTPRTVRYYIQQGLLPPPSGAGSTAAYSPAHVDRLRVIKALQREHLPLAEIRARMDAVGDADVSSLLAERAAPRKSDAISYIRAALTDKSPAYIVSEPSGVRQASLFPNVRRSTWEHYCLTPDVEVHVRRPLDRETNRKLDRLLEAARTLFTEPA